MTLTSNLDNLEKNYVSSSNLSRLQITIRGAVQGVGFRPFVYRLATELKLTGWVNNSTQGVFIEIEGEKSQLESFLLRLEQEKPPLSIIHNLEVSWLAPIGYTNFEIRASVTGEKTAVVLPDIATCPDCLQEIFNPTNRRYRYPFTNCTNCGPRYTIIQALPYDRSNTTMGVFTMCPQCEAEYKNPLNRRFHAQPNACPVCGPHLELWDCQGNILAVDSQALNYTVKAIREGKIVAVKGLGGFHLMVDATNETAVEQLRSRKRRGDKPFALMYPSLELIKKDCFVNSAEEKLLYSPESPIVLLNRKTNQTPQSRLSPIANAVAPGNPYLGVMLPYTPLHHLLMADLGKPVVATSGNISDEPICTDEREALERLRYLADIFLIHNRAIARPVDDSVVRIVAGREMILRRARGYAPLPIKLQGCQQPILAVGGHLKNAIALSLNHQVFISQHIGDLETPQAFDTFKNVIASFLQLYNCQPIAVACDAHPDYKSSHYARQLNLPIILVQHHYAHILACMAENQILGESILGIAWDGTGYGLDGTIWGGEFLLVPAYNSNQSFPFQRVAHLRAFRLPGGDKAVKEPRRSALGLLYEVFGDSVFENREILDKLSFSPQECKFLQVMLQKNLNTPITSSVGRLFDGIAALVGLCQKASFEGQAAMQLEFALDGVDIEARYKIEIGGFPVIIDWRPMLLGILKDLSLNLPVGIISAKFHNTLVEAIASVAKIVGEKRIVLTGGCFQNRYLIEKTISRLQAENFQPYWHQHVPPNDGGIALGQIVAASLELHKR